MAPRISSQRTVRSVIASIASFFCSAVRLSAATASASRYFSSRPLRLACLSRAVIGASRSATRFFSGADFAFNSSASCLRASFSAAVARSMSTYLVDAKNACSR